MAENPYLRESVLFARVLAAVLSSTAVVAFTATPAEAASAIQFGKIQYDSPGSDTGSNSSLISEYVVIKNTGTTSRSLTGWTVRDASSHIYTFGTFTLGAGKSVTLRSGSGTNSSTTRYWNKSWYVWNNTGDKAYLRNASGTGIDYCAWTSVGAGYKYC